MPEFDEAENARAALRALWQMSGQLEGADTLGEEPDYSGADSCGPSDGVGTTFMAHGGDESSGVGFSAYSEGTNEATFDRGEAARKFREAWKSQLALDGKLGGTKSLKDAAAKSTPQNLEHE